MPVFNAVNEMFQSWLSGEALANLDLNYVHRCFPRIILVRLTEPGILPRTLRGRRPKKI